MWDLPGAGNQTRVHYIVRWILSYCFTRETPGHQIKNWNWFSWFDFVLLVYQFNSVLLLSRVRLFATSWTAARQASLSITNSRSLLKLMSVESVMPSNHLILSSPSPSAFKLSQHQDLFQGVSSSPEVAKQLEFLLQHQSFQ